MAGLIMGAASPKSWKYITREVSLFDLKGQIVQLAEKGGLQEISFQQAESALFEDGGLDIVLHKNLLGRCGQFNKELLKTFELDELDIFAFEIDISSAEELTEVVTKYKPVPKFPAALRDLSMVVDSSIAVGNMLHEIEKRGGSFLHSVDLTDLFTGKQIPKGKKSLTFSLIFQEKTRTLRDEEVDTAVAEIIAGLEGQFGANLRTQ